MSSRFINPCIGLAALVLQQGCLFTATESVPSGARSVGLSDFNSSSTVAAGHVLQVPTEVTAAPKVVTTTEATTVTTTTATG